MLQYSYIRKLMMSTNSIERVNFEKKLKQF